jgi:hypothetical protein
VPSGALSPWDKAEKTCNIGLLHGAPLFGPDVCQPFFLVGWKQHFLKKYWQDEGMAYLLPAAVLFPIGNSRIEL